jgi:hypothetical protein
MNKKAEGTKKVKLLISNLFAQEETKVLKTIALLETEGRAEVIRPLMELYVTNKSAKINSKIVEIFNDLSDSSATPKMIELLRDEEFKDHRAMLSGSCWQNKLDFSPFLADFVALAVEGGFEECFECLTVIESLEGPFEEAQVLESHLHLKEYLDTEKGKDERKDQLMSDIAYYIKDFDLQVEEED